MVDFIMRFESGEATEEEIIEGFQEMIDSGVVWQLQGSYGRTANDLIEAGLCRHAKEQKSDYWGTQLPVHKSKRVNGEERD